MDLQERVNQLERSNRRLTQLGGFLLLSVGLLVGLQFLTLKPPIINAQPPAVGRDDILDKVVTKRLLVVDEKTKACVELGIGDNGPFSHCKARTASASRHGLKLGTAGSCCSFSVRYSHNPTNGGSALICSLALTGPVL